MNTKKPALCIAFDIGNEGINRLLNTPPIQNLRSKGIKLAPLALSSITSEDAFDNYDLIVLSDDSITHIPASYKYKIITPSSNPAQIVDSINLAIQNQSQSLSGIFVNLAITFDTNRHKATITGTSERIKLSPKTFRLLELFMALNPSQIWEYDDLIEHANINGGRNGLNAQIAALRKEINQALQRARKLTQEFNAKSIIVNKTNVGLYVDPTLFPADLDTIQKARAPIGNSLFDFGRKRRKAFLKDTDIDLELNKDELLILKYLVDQDGFVKNYADIKREALNERACTDEKIKTDIRGIRTKISIALKKEAEISLDGKTRDFLDANTIIHTIPTFGVQFNNPEPQMT